MTKIINYLKFSSFIFSIQFNPLQWRWIPYFFYGKINEWPDENVHQIKLSWIMFLIRVHIDDGSW